jgi:plasmid stability protein
LARGGALEPPPLAIPPILWNSETVKNVTVSIDDEAYRRARVRAAELGTSVSAVVRRFLDDLAASGRAKAAAENLAESARRYEGEQRRDDGTAPNIWDDFFDRVPKVSDDFMCERVQPEPEEREPF